MEQKVPKHRRGSLRDLAERRKVSHTTVRRQDQLWLAGMVLTHILGEDFEEALRSKRIRVGQQQLCQWYVMARVEPQRAKHIYSELLQHPEITMKVANHFIRVMYDEFRPGLTGEGRAMAREVGIE